MSYVSLTHYSKRSTNYTWALLKPLICVDANSFTQNTRWYPWCNPIITYGTGFYPLGKGAPQHLEFMPRAITYGCYWLEKLLRLFNTSPKWMGRNLFLQIIVTLKRTHCQVFIRQFYSSFSNLLENNLLLLCLLMSIGKWPLTCSSMVMAEPYVLTSKVPLQPTDKAGLWMRMAGWSPSQIGCDY